MTTKIYMLTVVLGCCLISAPVHAGLVGGSFAPGEGSVIRDITARADGTIVACGVLGESAKVNGANPLLSGDHGAGVRGFVAEFSGDLSKRQLAFGVPGWVHST